MLNPTRFVVQQILDRELRRVSDCTANLCGFGDDGDKMDDPMMHSIRERQDIARFSVDNLQLLLGQETSSVDTFANFNWHERVGLYSLVGLRITYSAGDYDEVSITIVDPIDALYLFYWPEYGSYFDGGDFDIASVCSPLAKIIVGHSVGETIGNLSGQFREITIVSTNMSDLLLF